MIDRDRELHEMADEGRALMRDYIKREDARSLINKSVSCLAPKVEVMGYKHGVVTGLNMACDIVEALSSADVAPVRHGLWECGEENSWWCSVCDMGFDLLNGTPSENLYYYCPNCGARMDGESDE